MTIARITIEHGNGGVVITFFDGNGMMVSQKTVASMESAAFSLPWFWHAYVEMAQ